jgi:hypothetical protein
MESRCNSGNNEVLPNHILQVSSITDIEIIEGKKDKVPKNEMTHKLRSKTVALELLSINIFDLFGYR